MRNITEDNNADIMLFKIERHPGDFTGKFNQFTGHNPVKSMHTSNAISYAQNRADLMHFAPTLKIQQFLFEDGGNFFRFDVR
jgi:hypothetical protein